MLKASRTITNPCSLKSWIWAGESAAMPLDVAIVVVATSDGRTACAQQPALWWRRVTVAPRAPSSRLGHFSGKKRWQSNFAPRRRHFYTE
jgi:hypothetical protein